MIEPNFMLFLEYAPDATVLYVSANIAEVLGFKPDEVIGLKWDFLYHPDDKEGVKTVYHAALKEDKLFSVILCRARHKEGFYVYVEVIGVICHDMIVVFYSLITGPPRFKCQLIPYQRVALVERTRVLDQGLETMDSFNRPISLIKYPNVDAAFRNLTPEPRVCLVINRFTLRHAILFASNASESLLGIMPEEMIGVPLLSYILPEDMCTVDHAFFTIKSHESMTSFPVVFLSPRYGELNLHAVAISCSDGIILLLRPDNNRYTVNEEVFISGRYTRSTPRRHPPLLRSEPHFETIS
ncbi:hypothetical protein K493DRAFT_310775 [Basidiobolus meristosporus CBS 931.73]|uniref:PAS domain-containing protein n=1 Tax=Basidiobolus meristosporus CBS 931.73 TaxID=1314790 RepID=A0A1Y1Z704_9FUNG|nr:hypothetical protein K493DRAFT_310775 [Basidiobolus meristosporus CBS 931.73]|eukprot:ORY05986.1 hypothetical protein K493DRAFT_310775 [Basidiobolus meristosporus CBS 931.73]